MEAVCRNPRAASAVAISGYHILVTVTATGLLRYFGIDLFITAIIAGLALWYGGPEALALVLILILVELVFSFDNAAVNAKYLQRLNPFWQRMFLTVGIIIAVFGMRLVFPFVVVWASAGIPPLEAWRLAMERGDSHEPGTYGYILHEAHPSIAAFGGVFLLMLFLDFLIDADRDPEETWLRPVERPLLRLGTTPNASTFIALVLLLVTAVLNPDSEQRHAVLLSGLIGVITYLVVHGFAQFMEERERRRSVTANFSTVVLSGRAAFSVFLFLEVLDASFSFDGVIGAFAITSDPLIIAAGLGVGALFVRSMTIFLVRTGALHHYKYLEHGAHWAIGALAVLLLVSIRVQIPELVMGLVGITIIGAAIYSSVLAARRTP